MVWSPERAHRSPSADTLAGAGAIRPQARWGPRGHRKNPLQWASVLVPPHGSNEEAQRHTPHNCGSIASELTLQAGGTTMTHPAELWICRLWINIASGRKHNGTPRRTAHLGLWINIASGRKHNDTPRRTVDLSPLNKHCKWEEAQRHTPQNCGSIASE